MKSSRLGTRIIYLNICEHKNLCDGNYVQYLKFKFSTSLEKNYIMHIYVTANSCKSCSF